MVYHFTYAINIAVEADSAEEAMDDIEWEVIKDAAEDIDVYNPLHIEEREDWN